MQRNGGHPRIAYDFSFVFVLQRRLLFHLVWAALRPRRFETGLRLRETVDMRRVQYTRSSFVCHIMLYNLCSESLAVRRR